MIDTSLAALAYCGIPAGVTTLAFWLLKRSIDRREIQYCEREKARKEYEHLLVKCVGASLTLGEVTAQAIKYGKTNGEMSIALEYAKKIKHEQREFLQRLGIGNLH
ncbi:MAG TPA: serine/threonine protein kinase [Clostridia bacterium]|nr:serine/threonine protein kinase [Clostridia bacterium]